MFLRPLRSLAPFVIAALALIPRTASPHPFEWGPVDPNSFSSVLHLIRDGLYDINQARSSGGTEVIRQRAERIATLAGTIPAFVFEVPAALEDSAVGRILQTSRKIGEAATALGRAAAANDLAEIEAQAALCAELVATLDFYVPARYVCPMHCEPAQTYTRPGQCPVCLMHLQRITSDRYNVEVRPDGPLRAGKAADLRFRLYDPAGFEVGGLQVVHEKLLHLMIVSQDLSRFAHEHPAREPDGSFRLRHEFPTGGTWVLFHDFTPDSVGMQVVPVPLVVEGPEPAPVPLVVDEQPKRVDGIEATLTHGPLAPGIECTMTFTLTRRGKTVTDLEPFLGTPGHLVMVSQDRGSFVHSHPRTPEISSGSVQFPMRFSRTGLYKAWGQFQRRGRVLTFPFVIEVTDAAASGSAEIPGSSR